jgi:hypothetical protein
MDAFDEARKALGRAQRDLDDNQRQKREAALTDPHADPNREAADRAKRERWTTAPRR